MEPQIIFTRDTSQSLDALIRDKNYTSVFILTDSNTSIFCIPLLENMQAGYIEIILPAGENNKDILSCEIIWNELTLNGADRNSLLVNLGGGVICDTGGFAASVFKRGIDFINIPTSLLAMADAAVGGKTGVNFNGIKNQIGLFSQAETVVIDPLFLKTLPEKEFISGYAEVCKYGLIADKRLWKDLLHFETQASAGWESQIKLCVNIKQQIVAGDLTEKGQRKILNFGHTIGHALESLSLHTGRESLLHGEAIAHGMIAEAYLSHIKSGLAHTELAEISAYLLKIFPIKPIEKSDYPALLDLIVHDKKNQSGRINFVLLKAIGHAVYDITCEEYEIVSSLDYISGLCNG